MLRLRDYIRAGATPPLATATVATVATEARPIGPTVATVAGVAVADAPESWPDRLRALDGGVDHRIQRPADGVRWDLAADALDVLLAAGVIDKALALGWDVRELIGVQRGRPHDHPWRAGLIFSMRRGDTVTDVRRAGCIIVYGNVRHIWKRAPIAPGVCLPWELAP